MMSFSSHFHGKVDQESDCYLMGMHMHLCRGHMSMSDVALMVVDECHHTVGNHSYAKIMDQHYHRVAAKELNNYLILLVLTQAKKSGLPVPKVLGLSASLVIRAVKQVDEFRTARAKLEQMLDAEVETAEELSLTKYVSSANEEVLEVPRRIPAAFNRDVVTEADEAQKQLRLIKMQAEIAINAEGLVSLSIS